MKKAVRKLNPTVSKITNWNAFFSGVVIPSPSNTKKGKAQRKAFEIRWNVKLSDI